MTQPITTGEVMHLPFMANADQLAAGALAKSLIRDDRYAAVRIQSVDLNDTRDEATVTMRYVDIRTGAEHGPLVHMTTKQRKALDTRRPYWVIQSVRKEEEAI